MERGWGAGVMNVYCLCKNGSFNFITRAAALKLMVQRALQIAFAAREIGDCRALPLIGSNGGEHNLLKNP